MCVVLGGHWDVQMGGAQFQAKCLVDVLRRRPQFETFYVAHAAPKKLQQDGYQIVPFGAGHGTNIFSLVLQLPSLYLTLRRLQPDVVYQRCLMPYTGVCALYCARHGAKMVYHIASDSDARRLKLGGWTPRRLLHRLSRSIAEYGLKRADVIVAQTIDQARLLKTEFGRDVTAVVPNFHPAPEVAAVQRDPRRLRVIWVGNFKPVKNPEQFVALAETFRAVPDVDFIMIGRPGGSDSYDALHQRIVGLRNLRFLGELPLVEVNSEVARSDLLVNTSSFEGFPNTFIQAWLRRVPVLSVVVDPDACLSKGGAGIRAGSFDKLAGYIHELKSDRRRLAALSDNANAYALANHHPDRAEALVRLLAPGS